MSSQPEEDNSKSPQTRPTPSEPIHLNQLTRSESMSLFYDVAFSKNIPTLIHVQVYFQHQISDLEAQIHLWRREKRDAREWLEDIKKENDKITTEMQMLEASAANLCGGSPSQRKAYLIVNHQKEMGNQLSGIHERLCERLKEAVQAWEQGIEELGDLAAASREELEVLTKEPVD